MFSNEFKYKKNRSFTKNIYSEIKDMIDLWQDTTL